jgi:hypothetical protein
VLLPVEEPDDPPVELVLVLLLWPQPLPCLCLLPSLLDPLLLESHLL